jgi:tetratricopeptide (TPR) repeat protein
MLAKKWFAKGEAEAQASNDVAAIKAYQCSMLFVPHGSTAYNIAQLAEKTGDLELAITGYEQYLELAERAQDVADVKERVETLKAKLAKVRENDKVTASGGAPPLENLMVKTQEEAAPKPVVPEPPPPGVSKSGHRQTNLRTVGWLTAGGGAVLIAGGVLTNVLARGQMDTCRKQYDEGHLSTAESACSNAKPLAYMSYAFLGVGAAAVATGVVLMFIRPKESSDVDVAVLPEGGLTLRYAGRF